MRVIKLGIPDVILICGSFRLTVMYCLGEIVSQYEMQCA